MEKKILIVDDELGIRELFYDLFSRKGYKTLTAPGGEGAIEIVNKEKPDLVLLDIKMPKLDGIETLKKIRKFDSKIKVVMLTALEHADLERQARLSGASGFLRKSLALDVISRAVDEILEEKPASSRNKNILVVDDAPGVCALIKDFLIKKDFNPVIATGAEEALEKVKRDKPAIVLLDINMPGMDGLVALKRIKEIDQSIGIIMITGVEDENIADEAMRLGAYDYIIKPVDLNYLEMCLLTKILLSTV